MVSTSYREVVMSLAALERPFIEIRCLPKGAGPYNRHSQWIWLPPDSGFTFERPEFNHPSFGPHYQWRNGHMVQRKVIQKRCPIFEIDPLPKASDGVNRIGPIMWDLDHAGINFFVTTADPPTFVFLTENDAIAAQATVLT